MLYTRHLFHPGKPVKPLHISLHNRNDNMACFPSPHMPACARTAIAKDYQLESNRLADLHTYIHKYIHIYVDIQGEVETT